MVTLTDDQHGSDQRGTTRGSFTVAGWTLVSRATGVARVVVVGAVLGPTFLTNAFLSTNTVPQIVFTVVAGSVLSSVVVPGVVRAVHESGRATAQALLARVSGLLLAGSAAVTVCLLALSPALAWILTIGVPEADRAEARAATTVLVLLVAPQVVLYTVAALGAAAQQARGRFGLAAGAPALENLALVATVGVLPLLYPTGLEIDDAPLGMVVLLGTGATFAVAIHAGAQCLGAARAGLSVRPRAGWRSDPLARELAVRLRASVGVAASPSLGYFALLAAAATVPGGVVVLQVAYQVYSLPIALGGRAVSTAVLPTLAESFERGDRPAEGRAWRQALTYAVDVGLPSFLLLVAFALPIAETLVNGELRDPALIASLAACITVLAVAQLAAAVHEVGRQVLFARLDVHGARRIARIHLVVVLSSVTALLALAADGPRLIGLAASVLAADLVAALLVLRQLRRGLHPEGLADQRRLRAAVIAGAAMLPVVGAGHLIVTANGPARLLDVPIALGTGAVALVMFVLTVQAITGRQGRRREPDVVPAVPLPLVHGVPVWPDIPVRPPLPMTRADRVRISFSVLAVVVVAAATVVAGPLVLVGAASIGLFLACARRPVLATYVYLGSLPFLVGIERDALIPLVRPNEALLALVVAGAVLGGVTRWVRGALIRIHPRPLDGPLVVFLVLATIWPLTSLMLRGRPPDTLELASLLPVVKLAGVLLLVRTTVDTDARLVRCVRLIVWPAGVVAVIAVLQTLGFSPVLDLLGTLWTTPDVTDLSDRGTTTFSHSIATGDYVMSGLALVIAFGVRGLLGRRERIVLGLVLGAGVFGAAQFSTWLGALVLAILVYRRVREVRRHAVRFLPVLGIAIVLGLPALLGRLEGFGTGLVLPQSWLVRWDNVTTFYLPPLAGPGFVLGVSPNTVLEAPETWREEIFLESGYVQLLWLGGLPLLCAFAWLSVMVLRRARALSVRRDGVGGAATALEIVWVVVLVLSVLDIHLLLRGMGEVLATLIAIATGRLHEKQSER